MVKLIDICETPITDDTFKRQGWEKNEDQDEDDNNVSFYYWTLRLPKTNPDENCQYLISTCNDEWEEYGIPTGTYQVEIYDFNSLGKCDTEEQIEGLYKSLTGENLM